MESKRAKDLKKAVRILNELDRLGREYGQVIPYVSPVQHMELAAEAARASGKDVNFVR
jgi:hypothetical protein